MPAGRPRQFDEGEVLEKAIGVFWARGFEVVTIADIVEATGVGRQSLYDTFGDKMGLYCAALEAYVSGSVDMVVGVLKEEGSGLGNIRRVLGMWEAHNSKAGCKGCMMANALAEFGTQSECVSEVVLRTTGRIEKAFRGALDRAVMEGELDADTDTLALARTLATLGHGLSLAGRMGRGSAVVSDVVRTIEKLLV